LLYSHYGTHNKIHGTDNGSHYRSTNHHVNYTKFKPKNSKKWLTEGDHAEENQTEEQHALTASINQEADSDQELAEQDEKEERTRQEEGSDYNKI